MREKGAWLFVTVLLLGWFFAAASASAGGGNTIPRESRPKEVAQGGCAEVYRRGYLDGYRRALRDLRAELERFRRDYEAYQAGKYFLRKGWITYPRVYREVRNGIIYLRVEGCRFEPPIPFEALFQGVRIPLLEAGPAEKSAGCGDKREAKSFDRAIEEAVRALKATSLAAKDRELAERDLLFIREAVRNAVALGVPYVSFRTVEPEKMKAERGR
ncbi:hypothetical protein [Thermosulfurimonas sp. F29]|uniref:hypothetical protein n=1 Tax=Thermosulfurimonas sp. F29 TaxID=2867247 RepID=UPI001C832D1C|nr:hypothetical protein [Thermosulfurimonas sp. F29]MBX6424105.1 hypothetical protein [Thermosulfurimonas sp. F29]